MQHAAVRRTVARALLLLSCVAFPTASNSAPCDARAWGAAGDGRDDTEALQAALAHCAVTVVRNGSFVTGPLRLRSHSSLVVSAGAALVAKTGSRGWPREVVDGEDMFAPLVAIDDADHATLTGGGAIDGRGDAFWYEAKDAGSLSGLKPPRLVRVLQSRNVEVSGLSLLRSPFWTVHIVRSRDVAVRNVTVRNLGHINTDGVDVDSSEDTLIEHCNFAVRDDVVAYKAKTAPCRRHLLRHNTFRGRSSEGKLAGGGIAIGSEVQFGVSDVFVHDCTVSDAGAALYVKTNAKRGGYIRNITFVDISMTNVHRPLLVQTDYGAPKAPGGDDCATPAARGLKKEKPMTQIDGLRFSHIRFAAGPALRGAGQLQGTSAMPLRGLVFEDFTVVSAANYTGAKTLKWDCRCAFGKAKRTTPPLDCLRKAETRIFVQARGRRRRP